jgi:Na+-transporting methylmalonyl-CoA/oxaloacetate decarboxylase gamma subunit
MDQAIGILGQAVLVLAGLCLVVVLVFLLLIVVRAIRRLLHELRQPLTPETDSYVPPSFDRW